MAHKSDIIVIGGGPGGYETAIEAAAGGLQVTLFERDSLGGTCLNRGCIPTKALCRSAEVLTEVREAGKYGVSTGEVTADYASAHSRMVEVVASLRDGVKSQLAGVHIVKAEASLGADRSVIADGEVYTADKIIIATGSRPARLGIEGGELAMTSDELLSMSELPESIVIIGGGVIGLEFASILNAYGPQVTIIEYCKEILPTFDADIAKRMRTMMSRRGVKFVVSAAVTSITREGAGYRVAYSGKRGDDAVEASAVLMATGRQPVMPEGLDEAGVEYSSRGIKVDSHMLTTAPGVYAIGDVNGLCMLAHAATAQGRVALGAKVDLDVIPSAVFAMPEAAMVGCTYAQAQEKYGERVRAHTVQYGASGKAVAMGESLGVVKMLTLDDDKRTIVGCAIVGAHASDLIQEVALAMSAGLGAKSIANTVHAHPTLSELVMMAAK